MTQISVRLLSDNEVASSFVCMVVRVLVCVIVHVFLVCVIVCVLCVSACVFV